MAVRRRIEFAIANGYTNAWTLERQRAALRRGARADRAPYVFSLWSLPPHDFRHTQRFTGNRQSWLEDL